MAANTSSTAKEMTGITEIVEKYDFLNEEFEELTEEHRDSLDCMALNLTRNSG